MSRSSPYVRLASEPAVQRWGLAEDPHKILAEYRVERALRWALLNAPASDRGQLYATAFEEVLRRSSDDPINRQDLMARSEAHAVATARALRRFLTTDARIAEIGPGDGRLSRMLCAVAARVTMVDVRNTLARRSDRPGNLNLLVTDGTGAPLPKASLDLVFADQLIEHLHPDDVEPIHRDVFEALVPGGVFICYSPNRVLGPHDLSRYFGDAQPRGLHLKEYSMRELAALLRGIGFDRVRPLIGARSVWAPAPLWLLGGLEGAIDALPSDRRLGLVRLPLLKPALRLLLGARLAAWKPVGAGALERN